MRCADDVRKHFSSRKQLFIRPELYFKYASLSDDKDDIASAIEYYKKAQNINPSKEETYINLAQIYLEQKDYNKAQDICERGLMMMPDNNDLKRYLTDSKNSLMNNDFEIATKLYEQGKIDIEFKD